MFTIVSNNNSEYLQALFELEKWKAHLIKIRFDYNNVINEIIKSKFDMGMISDSLEYLKLYSKIVSLREFKNMRFQYAGQHETLISLQKARRTYEKAIQKAEKEIEKREIILPTLKSVVLEFRSVKK